MAVNPKFVTDYVESHQAYADVCGQGLDETDQLLLAAKEQYRLALEAYIDDQKAAGREPAHGLEDELESLSTEL